VLRRRSTFAFGAYKVFHYYFDARRFLITVFVRGPSLSFGEQWLLRSWSWLVRWLYQSLMTLAYSLAWNPPPIGFRPPWSLPSTSGLCKFRALNRQMCFSSRSVCSAIRAYGWSSSLRLRGVGSRVRPCCTKAYRIAILVRFFPALFSPDFSYSIFPGLANAVITFPMDINCFFRID
jgi:hypothetical protein